MSQIVAIKKTMDRYQDQILKALPASMQSTAQIERMKRIAMTEVSRNTELQKCDAMSIVGSIVHIAAFGLEPGAGFGHAYLVPYSKKCTVIIGYRGYIELARRSREIKKIIARIVRSNDEFHISYGSDEKLTHVPNLAEHGEMIGSYAIAWLTNGEIMFDYMTKDQIDKIKDKVRNQHVWSDHYEEMARKTVVRRLYKYLPSNPDVARATELEDTPADDQNNWDIIDPEYEIAEPTKEERLEKNAELHAEVAKDSEDQILADSRIRLVKFLTELSQRHGQKEVYEAAGLKLDFDANAMTKEGIDRVVKVMTVFQGMKAKEATQKLDPNDPY